MERNQTKPLNCEQAKARLREAAKRASPSGYVYQHPAQSLLIALAAGYFVSHLRIPRAVSINLVEKLLPIIITQSFKSRRKSHSREK